jgi:hypothetical protein
LAAYLRRARLAAVLSLRRMLYRERQCARCSRGLRPGQSYLEAQIEAGAEVVQLFDTWAGLLGEAEYREWVLPTHREIAAKLGSERAPLILSWRRRHLSTRWPKRSGCFSLDWRADSRGRAAPRPARRAAGQPDLRAGRAAGRIAAWCANCATRAAPPAATC